MELPVSLVQNLHIGIHLQDLVKFATTVNTLIHRCQNVKFVLFRNLYRLMVYAMLVLMILNLISNKKFV